jgi:hypothetical protein
MLIDTPSPLHAAPDGTGQAGATADSGPFDIDATDQRPGALVVAISLRPVVACRESETRSRACTATPVAETRNLTHRLARADAGDHRRLRHGHPAGRHLPRRRWRSARVPEEIQRVVTTTRLGGDMDHGATRLRP